MNNIGAIINSVRKLIPSIEEQEELLIQLDAADTIDAAPAGAILIGMHMLEYLGFSKYVDELLGEEHLTIEQLKNHYNNKTEYEKPMIPSTGIILSLMVADMISCSREITAAYQFEEMAEKWHTGPLLGIEPSLLNDDRIGRAMSFLGGQPEIMQEILFNMVIDAAKKAEIPLNKFILDTTLLELDGKFKDASKVVPGRGKNSLSQLIVSLVVASGSRLPIGFGVLAGNTSDSTTLPDVYETVNKVADDGAVEFLMDRIYPTPSNILYLKEHQDERMVYWVSPLKIGLSQKRVREQIDKAYSQEKWKPISYRSTKEYKAKINPPLTVFETTWMLTEKIKPDLEPGQKRRPRGSIKTVEIEVRCAFYRHEINAKKEKEKREVKRSQLEKELQDFCTKLNKRKYRELEYCKKKLTELLKSSTGVKKFVQYDLIQSSEGIISLTWFWDEFAINEETKYDGIFALLTNYAEKQVNSNQLVKKYRGRDQIEVDFKQMKGLLDLERVLYQRSERIESYIFLKVIAFFVLAFSRYFAAEEGVKTTEKKIQESMGNMLLVENVIMPLGMKIYAVARDNELNQLFRRIFSLPDPKELIKVLTEAEKAQIDDYVSRWYKKWLKENYEAT